ncbi:MAG TPA: hypothetical protein VNM40_00735 [Candidatus Paceibacterota bacterium]|nr:hypothetical protein [Candidatus Paceibacterota bacterium]
MQRITHYRFHELFADAVILELRILRALSRAIGGFFIDLLGFILGIDIRDRRD